METKRLSRSLTDRKIAGVAGGLAEYLAVDPLLIRMLFIILFLVGGGGLIIYIILWIVTPEQTLAVNSASSKGPASPPDPQTTPGSDHISSFSTSQPASSAPVSEAQSTTSGTSKGSLVGGLVLITLGAIFLADEFIPRWNFGDLWPLILVVIGVALLFNAFMKRTNS